ncbi:MAG: hypothetical protein M3464_00380 [Chloroflexota bacterium]|nr:hypothetical protein [Chloroflexota bacterium]
MPADVLRVTVGDATDLVYVVEAPTLRATLTATVSAMRVTGDGETLLHSDRLILDRHAARVKFAEVAGTDPNDLATVRERLIEHLTAEPVADAVVEESLDPNLEAAARALLVDPDLLDRFGRAVRKRGYAGDIAQPKILFLVAITRRLERPTNVLVEGPSAAGKSYLVDQVLSFLPASAYYQIAGSSPRALVYGEASLKHRFLVIGEADGMHQEGMGASIIRGLVWGNELRYETVESTAAGMKPVSIVKEGPTGLITTGTKGLEPELATRMLSVAIPDDPETTRQIIAATAARANGHVAEPVDLAPWHAAQIWLDREGCWEVTIPFGEKLAASYPVHLVRARRDFVQLLHLIRASAVLHQLQRERDEHGRIVADVRDYRTIYDLAGPTFGIINAGGVTAAVRRVVQAVADLLPDKGSEPASAVQVADKLGLHKSVVSRHLRAAIKAGHVINDESRRGQPMKLRPGDPLPEAKPALPDPDMLFGVRDPPGTSATVQPPPENPHADAEADGCMSGCSDATGNATVQPETRGVATALFTATRDGTADLGSSAEKSIDGLRSCTVAGGVPDFATIERVCLDCGSSIANGFYCELHGGGRRPREDAAETVMMGAPVADESVSPDPEVEEWVV